MTKRVQIRLRPMRSLAFAGVMAIGAMPVSVAVAGPEEHLVDTVDIGEDLVPGIENAQTADLIPTEIPEDAGITAGQLPDLAEQVSGDEAVTTELLGIGEASWYGPRFAGRPTANGETFDPSELTAAHRTLPFGSRVRVTSQRTGKSVVVRINDRGPYHGNRVIDLSEAAAKEIGLKSRGRGKVELALLGD